ncbi:hypothetical protein TNCV_3357491 [Trichonephila clavipes]|nr:hypothetical protein TNCV_3357491 [Trichonephila clavipes]
MTSTPFCGFNTRSIQTELSESLSTTRDLRPQLGGWFLRLSSQRVSGHPAAVRTVEALRRSAAVLPGFGRSSQRTQVHR